MPRTAPHIQEAVSSPVDSLYAKLSRSHLSKHRIHMNPKFTFLVLPFTRAEVPKWPLLMNAVSADWDTSFQSRWQGQSKVVVRGKNHGFLMNLDLSDWAQRMTYFLARYYELGVARVLELLLRPGDRFVDIGANIGMITLHARSLVGSSGRIDCFEPNPDCVDLLQKNLAINEIQNVVVHQCALAEASGALTLSLTSGHSGTATLADVGTKAVRKIVVDVRVGDDVLTEAPQLIKIDVEGFELQVLRGLRSTLTIHKPFVITELIERQLALAGTSVREMADYLFSLNYRAYGIVTQRKNLRSRLVLRPISPNGEFVGVADVLWIHADRLGDVPSLSKVIET